MITPFSHPTFFGSLAIGVLLCSSLHAQNPVINRGGKPVHFRQSQMGLSALQSAPSGVHDQGTASDATDLEEQVSLLETEVNVFKAKYEMAKRRLDLATQGGNLEQVDKLEQDVESWKARYDEKRNELAQLEAQLTPATSSASSASAGSAKDIIVPGENLDVYVNEDPSFNGKYQVRRGGYIIIPSVGRIVVAGKTINEAESALKKALLSSQLQSATVLIEPLEGTDVESGRTIFLSGEFRHPRPYKIPPGTAATLVSVILSSEGVTDNADLTRVKVMRMAGSKGVDEVVNVQKILDGGLGGGLGSDVPLYDGDVIIIPTGQPSLIYVTGNVKHQGSYKLKSGEKLTAYGVILQSGGFARFADKGKVYVLRAMPDGTKVKIPVDVNAVTKGTRPDVQLQVNDIVVVPEKWFSL